MSSKADKSERKSLRKMLSSRKKGKEASEEPTNGSANHSISSESNNSISGSTKVREGRNTENSTSSPTATATASPGGDRGRSDTARNRNSNNGTGVLGRLRSRSRSRRTEKHDAAAAAGKELLVAVTSCRSDGYYNEKAPGSVSKLPRKAPTNLKLFHELAVGVKDAYEAVNATPRRPTEDDQQQLEADEYQAKLVLWDFIGNLNFVSHRLVASTDFLIASKLILPKLTVQKYPFNCKISVRSSSHWSTKFP